MKHRLGLIVFFCAVCSVLPLGVVPSRGEQSPASTLGPPASTLGPLDGRNPNDQTSVKRTVNSEEPLGKAEKDALIVTSDYYIGPEDVLEIIVWRNADLSKVVTSVRMDVFRCRCWEILKPTG